ncbi:MAG TPA: hypothetical protein VJN71_02170 [Nitrososphaerales archaeon]|nr:hypothetical protein [Nitrososphaerales archaeon]
MAKQRLQACLGWTNEGMLLPESMKNFRAVRTDDVSNPYLCLD